MVNEMNLNLSKTRVLTFSTRYKENPQGTRFLGVVFQEDLRWSQHIAVVCTKLSQQLYLLRKLMEVTTYDTARTAYFGNFHSLAVYGILVWGSSPALHDVFLKQKKAVRILASKRSRDSCRLVFRELGIMTVPGEFILSCLCYAHVNRDNFPTGSLTHQHYTRNQNLLTIPYHRVTRSQQSTNYLCVKLYNKLPREYTTLHTAAFKRKIKQLLTDSVCYSTEEFLHNSIR